MLDRVSTVVLGLDGLGEAERLADYSQWDSWQRSQQAKGARNKTRRPRADGGGARTTVTKKKLSFIEARESESIEKRIAEAEQELRRQSATLEDPVVMGDVSLLESTCVRIAEVQKIVDDLYARWAELEQAKG
jgi:ATP-binding cassette subfamily F protein uup